MKLIYLLDDDCDTFFILQTWLRKKDYEVQGFSVSSSFFSALAIKKPDAVLMDIHLGREDGRQVCREMRSRYSERIPVILFSMVYPDIQDIEDTCADDFVRKDSTLADITNLINKHVGNDSHDLY